MKKTYRTYTDALTGQVDDFDLVTDMQLRPDGSTIVTGIKRGGSPPDEVEDQLNNKLFLSAITVDRHFRKK